MDSRTVEEIEGWDGGRFDGDLHALADRGFSGAVRADGTYLFAVGGQPVGVFDYRTDPTGEPTVEPSDVADLDGTDGETFASPHDALPLLYAMEATGGEERGSYYTNRTPIEEVDQTLQEGGFTGYLELSENVLSGDYFLVYHGGERRSVAFIGQSRRLKTDDEAYELACDEVGIYSVMAVDLPRLELPEPPEEDESTAAGAAGAGAGAGAAGAAVGAAGAATDEEAEGPEADGTDAEGPEADGTDAEGPEADGTEADTAVPSAGPDPTGDGDETEQAAGADDHSAGEDAPTGADPVSEGDGPEPGADGSDEGEATEAADSDVSEAVAEVDPDAGSAGDESADPDGAARAEQTDTGEEAGPDAGETSDAPEATSEDVEAAAAAIDSTSGDDTDTDADGEGTGDGPGREPGESGTAVEIGDAGTADDAGDDGDAVDTGEADAVESAAAAAGAGEDAAVADDHVVPSIDPDRSERESGAAPAGDTGADEADAGPGGAGTEGATAAGAGMVDGETREALREELAAREREAEELEAELAEREGELDEIRERLAAVESERDELRGRVQELESRLEAVGAAAGKTERSLSPEEALAGTSLFVRYRSKRDPTLEDVHDSGADQSGVRDNLRLEHHTQFDAGAVSVDGQRFDAFLEGTQAHAFVRWLVEEFPFEVRDTGNTGTMADLYDGLPSLDRLEFGGEVDTDDGAKSFDVVGRDRMGQPLVVANLEDVRDPTDEMTMAELVKGATAVAEAHDGLAGAFAVTASYFEPTALETAREATSGSLLSRSKRKSFVKLSRNRGYHLCLVEDREESFYLSVPEL